MSLERLEWAVVVQGESGEIVMQRITQFIDDCRFLVTGYEIAARDGHLAGEYMHDHGDIQKLADPLLSNLPVFLRSLKSNLNDESGRLQDAIQVVVEAVDKTKTPLSGEFL